MADINDILTLIVCNSADWDLMNLAETDLRKAGHTDLADRLLKLVQDAGVEYDPSFGPENHGNAPGPQTHALWDAYEPVTEARVTTIFKKILEVLGDEKIKTRLRQALESIGLPTQATTPFPAPEHEV